MANTPGKRKLEDDEEVEGDKEKPADAVVKKRSRKNRSKNGNVDESDLSGEESAGIVSDSVSDTEDDLGLVPDQGREGDGVNIKFIGHTKGRAVGDNPTGEGGSWKVAGGRRAKGKSPNADPVRGNPGPPSDPMVFKFPVVIEDLGTGTDQYSKYGAASNQIWTVNRCGKIVSQKRCKHPGRWLIECSSLTQQQYIAQQSTIKTPTGSINIKAHIPVEQTEGVIRPVNKEWSDSDIEGLIGEASGHTAVKSVSRLFMRGEGETQTKSNAVRVTFLASQLPSELKVGTQFYKVEPYRRHVLRCYKCHKLDHRASDCPRRTARCPRGCPEAHPQGVKDCPRSDRREWKCVNCNSVGHSAAYQGCPARRQLSQAYELRAQHCMPLGVALRHVKSRQSAQQQQQQQQRAHMARGEGYGGFPPLHASTGLAAAGGAMSVWGLPFLPHRAHEKEEERANFNGDQSSGRRMDSPTNAMTQGTNAAGHAGLVTQGAGLEGSTGLAAALDAVMHTVNKKLEEMSSKTEQLFEHLNTQIGELREERKTQLKTVESIVRKNRNKNHDAVTSMAFEVVDSMRQAALGHPEALMATLFKIVPKDAKKSMHSPPCMSDDLQTAVLGVVGLSVKEST